MCIQASHPTVTWSQKYARRYRGLSTDKIARYGRHILEVKHSLLLTFQTSTGYEYTIINATAVGNDVSV